jgi:hypothetical protein
VPHSSSTPVYLLLPVDFWPFTSPGSSRAPTLGLLNQCRSVLVSRAALTLHEFTTAAAAPRTFGPGWRQNKEHADVCVFITAVPIIKLVRVGQMATRVTAFRPCKGKPHRCWVAESGWSGCVLDCAAPRLWSTIQCCEVRPSAAGHICTIKDSDTRAGGHQAQPRC